MKLKTNILFSLLLCGTFATAQNLKLDILPPSVTLGQDSAIVSMKMTLNVPQMDTKSHIRLTPVLTDGTHTAELPQILLNGEQIISFPNRTGSLEAPYGSSLTLCPRCSGAPSFPCPSAPSTEPSQRDASQNAIGEHKRKSLKTSRSGQARVIAECLGASLHRSHQLQIPERSQIMIW